MSICEPCTLVDSIPNCVDNLTLGNVSALSTNVYVYQRHVGSSRIVRYDVTSGLAGEVTIQPVSLMDEQNYEFWVTLATATSLEAREDITVSGTAYTCLITTVYFVNQNDGTAQDYNNITLAIS